MKDGLYQITYNNICAGFTIKYGNVAMCAPILRRMLTWWYKRAVRLSP